MKYRPLTGTGTLVSNIALGTMGFGTETPQDEAFAILDRFIDAGGNLIDTANVYGAGASEELLGRWFADRPADVTDRVVLATKGRFGTGPDTNQNGTSRRSLDRALSASLNRLARNTIDLYQLHAWDPLTPSRRRCSFSTTPSGTAASTTSACPTSPDGRCSSPCPPQRPWACTCR